MATRDRSVLILAALLLASQAQAQTIYESSSGESSILIQGMGVALINFADKTIKGGWSFQQSAPSPVFGLEVKLKASDGKVSILSENAWKIPPSTSASAFVGGTWTMNGTVKQYFLLVQGTYTHAVRAFADTSNAATTRYAKSTFDDIGGKAYLNGVYALGNGVEGIFGLTAGYGGQNNYDDLRDVEVCSIVGSSPSVQECRAAKAGVYESRVAMTAGADLLLYPRFTRNRVGLAVFAYHDDGRAPAKKTDVGTGIFVSKSGKPLEVFGGVTVEWRGPETRFGLQAGVPFP